MMAGFKEERHPIDWREMIVMTLNMNVSPLRICRGTSQRVVALAIAFVIVTVTGCAMTFGYRHADWLLRWQLDHYLDLNSAQRRDVTARLQPLLSRHRAEALPQYEQLLGEVQQRVRRGLTREDVEWVYATYDRMRADLFERAAPDGAALITTITDKQIRNFEEVVRKEEQQAARRLQTPASARLNERAKTILSLVEEWAGPVSAAQAAQIRQWSISLPDTQPAWWDYRRHRHQELVTLMRRGAPANEAAQALRAMFVTPEKSAPRAYLDSVKDLRSGLMTLLLGIDRSLTPVQRLKLIGSLQKLIEDIHALRAG